MNINSCDALNGSNPLHFLAALGLFRLLSLDDETTTLAWTDTFPHTPLIATRKSDNECLRNIQRHLGIRGSMALNTRLVRIRHVQSELKSEAQLLSQKTDRESKIRRKEITVCSKAMREKERRVLRLLGTEKRLSTVRLLQKKHPFAGAADSIHNVPPEILRKLVADGLPPLWDALLPGLVVDLPHSYKKGEVGILRSRLSFSNGGSGKAILKDWLTSLATLRRPRPEENHLLGLALQVEPVTGLMWDPQEMRDHALRWLDPTTEETCSVPLLNVLAFIGLSFLTVLPVANFQGEHTVGVSRSGKQLVWPIWELPLTAPVVASMLAADFTHAHFAGKSAPLGISTVLSTSMITANKRKFLTPSHPV